MGKSSHVQKSRCVYFAVACLLFTSILFIAGHLHLTVLHQYSTHSSSSHAVTSIQLDRLQHWSTNNSTSGVSDSKQLQQYQGPSAFNTANKSSLISRVIKACGRAQRDPAHRTKLLQAASTPIHIAVMTGLFWQLPTDSTKGCEVDGIPLDCHIQKGGTEVRDSATNSLSTVDCKLPQLSPLQQLQ